MRLFSCIVFLAYALTCCPSISAQDFGGGSLTIPTFGPASPYPATIDVSNVSGTVTNVSLTITNISHTFPNDIAAVVVGPLGQTVLLFDGPGDGTDAVNLTWTFTDSAASTLPSSGPLSSGTFRPGQNDFSDELDPPAPGLPYGTQFSVFNNTNVNGTWSLFVQDFVGDDGGSIGSWSLSITAIPEPTTWAFMGLAGFAGTVSWVRFNRRQKRSLDQLITTSRK